VPDTFQAIMVVFVIPILVRRGMSFTRLRADIGNQQGFLESQLREQSLYQGSDIRLRCHVAYVSKKKQLYFVVVTSLCLVIFVGCDPVRTVSQEVRVTVLDLASSQPVAGARIQVKRDFEQNDHVIENTQKSSNESEQHEREFWERQPWHSGLTDEAGVAKIEIVETALDRSSGDKPPASRDLLSGQVYILKVSQDNQAVNEQLRVKIALGANIVGDRISVSVSKIGQPRYVADNR